MLTDFKAAFPGNTECIINEASGEIAFLTDEDYADALSKKISGIKCDTVKSMKTLF